MFDITLLWRAPEINPVNQKARSIPGLNPINQYGRVFFFSWWGFMIAFWSWYAFPPLLSEMIAADIGLSSNEIANSNIIALVATLLVRFASGPLCDKFGPRYTFAGILLAGAIPTFLAGAVYNAPGLMVLRFFVGILGGSFVPCQVWSTGFFDKNVVGSANAFTAGFGNAGGGLTYQIMPHLAASLVNDGLTPHVAWRVAFIVPGVVISLTAVAMILLCDDCPTGKWSERRSPSDANLSDISGLESPPSFQPHEKSSSMEKIQDPRDAEAQKAAAGVVEEARGEVIVKPTFREMANVVLSLPTVSLGAAYLCSFGAELAVNSILGSYYSLKFPTLGVTGTGNWAAMFGLLNVVTRPLGGLVSDLVYRKTHSLWLKKTLIVIYGIITGVFLIVIGQLDSNDSSTMFGLVAGCAFFLEGANGLVFSLVPHVHPYANGIISGFTGACGNLGGVIFAIVFRYNGTDYGRAFWIIGVIIIAVHISVAWIRPVPKGQIGGH